MEPFMSLVVVALLVEAVVNLIKNIEEKNTSWKYWASLVFGVFIAVLVSVNWDVDIFTMVGLSAGKIPFVGPVLTGLIISRGANVLSDLIKLINVGLS